MYAGNRLVAMKYYYLNIPKEKFTLLYEKIKKTINDEDFKQEFLEEVVGNFSSSGFVAFFSMLGGSIAILLNPIVGTFILIISIAYGSFLKVCCGRYYRRRYINKRKISPESERFSNKLNLEIGIANVLKKWGTSSSVKFIHTNSSKYGFIRLSSKLSTRSRKVHP